MNECGLEVNEAPSKASHSLFSDLDAEAETFAPNLPISTSVSMQSAAVRLSLSLHLSGRAVS